MQLMEITTRIDGENNLRTHAVKGVINVRELKGKMEKYYKSPEYDPDMNSLWDLSGADFRDVKPEHVRSLAEMVSRSWGGTGSKAALVVSQDLGYGLSRMYEMLLSGISSSNVMVFRSTDEAGKWLEG
jgi:hypothetical protein